MFILKKSSQSVSPIKWSMFALLPRQQFHWEVLMATRIGKLQQNSNIGSSICMSNALDLFPRQSSITTDLLSEVIACAIFDLMLCSTLINPSVWLSALKQAFVNISISLLFLTLSLASGSSKARRVSKKMYKPLDLISALEMYMHLYIGSSCIVWRLLWCFFLWSIFTFWVRSFQTKPGITTHVLCFNPSRNDALIQPF